MRSLERWKWHIPLLHDANDRSFRTSRETKKSCKSIKGQQFHTSIYYGYYGYYIVALSFWAPWAAEGQTAQNCPKCRRPTQAHWSKWSTKFNWSVVLASAPGCPKRTWHAFCMKKRHSHRPLETFQSLVLLPIPRQRLESWSHSASQKKAWFIP